LLGRREIIVGVVFDWFSDICVESNLAASQVAAELDAVNEEDTATLQNTDITEPIEHNTYKVLWLESFFMGSSL
jgi:hypothetical protein